MNKDSSSTEIPRRLKSSASWLWRVSAWAMAGCLWLSACSQKPSSESPLKTSDAATQPAAWEECLGLWTGGNQPAAVEKFLAMDWDAPGLFSSSSPLHYSEAEIVAMSEATRGQVMKQAAAEIQVLKSLAARVQEIRKQALAQKDQAKADQCVQCLQRCGARLEQPSSMRILQLVGTAVRKLAAREP